MSTIISTNGGYIGTSGAWSLCDPTSENDSVAANSVLTTSYVASTTFTPGAITISGIAVRVNNIVASPTGTISVALDHAGTTVTGTEVTINCIDLNNTAIATGPMGWVVFAFASPVTLVTATTYSVKAKTSTSTQVTLWSLATTNWSRELITTTAQAPVAGDKVIIAGNYTGPATGNLVEVTMNATSAVAYGAASMTDSICVSGGGCLTFAYAASTNYILEAAGLINVYQNGTLNVGTSVNPIPSTSTAVITFSQAANVDSGLQNLGGTITAYGAPKTLSTMLTSDISVGATSIAIGSTSGWAASDSIVIASTTQTAAQSEKVTVSGVGSSTTATIGATTYAHSGTSALAAEVINLTQNVKIFGASSTHQAFVYLAANGSTTMQYVECYYLGANLATKLGFEIANTTGTAPLSYMSLHDCIVAGSSGFYINANNAGISLSNCVFNNINNYCVYAAGASIGYTFSNCVAMNATYGFYTISSGATYSYLTAVSCSNTGIYIIGNTLTASNLVAHACASGVTLTSNNNPLSGTINTAYIWRNLTYGLTTINLAEFVFNNLTLAGNTTYGNMYISGGGRLTLNNCSFNGDSTFSSYAGIEQLYGTPIININNSAFGNVVPHSNYDIYFRNTAPFTYAEVNLQNTILASAVPVGAGGLSTNGFLGASRLGGTAGNHKFWKKYGTGSADTSIFNNAPFSLRLTPNSASNKLTSLAGYSSGFGAVCGNGNILSVSIAVRESVVGDGTAYNGNYPRLMLRANNAVGITTDQVIATATSASSGAWQIISGVTPSVTDDCELEFYVDCDGTAGWVNVGTFAVSNTGNPSQFRYWCNGFPSVTNVLPVSNTLFVRR